MAVYIACPVCGCDPCDCDGVAEVKLVKIRYRVKDVEHSVWVPKSLADKYFKVYRVVDMMLADGTIVEYSSGGVGMKEPSHENE